MCILLSLSDALLKLLVLSPSPLFSPFVADVLIVGLEFLLDPVHGFILKLSELFKLVIVHLADSRTIVLDSSLDGPRIEVLSNLFGHEEGLTSVHVVLSHNLVHHFLVFSETDNLVQRSWRGLDHLRSLRTKII